MTDGTAVPSPAPSALRVWLVRYFAGRARALRLAYKQVLFVWLAFFLLFALSYIVVERNLYERLRKSTDEVLSRMQFSIVADLAAPERMLRGMSESLRHMIERGHDVQNVLDFMKTSSVYALGNQGRNASMSALFGCFDVFGGIFLTGGVWQPPAGYEPQQRPWCMAAAAANGGVVMTDPYESPLRPGTVIAYARRIFAADGRPLATVAIDVAFDKLRQDVVNMRLTDTGYGVLLDARLAVLAHKDALLCGKPLGSISRDAAKLAEDMHNGVLFERVITNYRGETSVVSCRMLPNGWHLLIVTPLQRYFREGHGNLRGIFMLLCVSLATVLSMVLLRLAAARDRTDERTRLIHDATPLCTNFWIKTEGGYKNIDCNQEAARLFDLSSKREYLERFHELSPEYQPCGRRSDEKATALVQQTFEEGYCRFEWMHRKPDGELIPTEVTLVRVEYYGEFTVMGYTRDLRELKIAEERLAAENAQRANLIHWYESMLNAVPLPVSVQDEDGKWTFVNAALAELIGQAPSALLGLPCSMCKLSICETDRCAMTCAKRGETQTGFVYLDRSYLVNVGRMRDIRGAYTGFIETIHDVTDIEHLTRQKMEVEGISHAKSAFLAMVSHEVRTPLNAILGITEMQMQNDALPQATADAFNRIYAASWTLFSIINDILDMSRLEAGKVELTPSRYSVATLLSDTAQLNMVRIGSKPIAFKLHVDEEMPSELFGDELRIKQILSNLISNAFKYTDAGEVALSVTAEYGHGAEDPEVTLVCRVSDTGQGMTPEQVSRLFDEYSRFNLDANRTIEGVGLGMAITRELVQLMGGVIDVESAPGRGTTFTVRLPQELFDAGSLGKDVAEDLRKLKFSTMLYGKGAPIARDPMPYGSVLIVDDLETNMYVVRGLLEPYDLSIDCAASGFEALDKIRGGKEYDIVLMDHMMPKMDGVETTKIMRELGYARPIIALTANAAVGQSEIFLESGFNGFLDKPVDLRRLDMLLNRLIRDKQPSEVIEAARRQKAGQQGGVEAPASAPNEYLARVFVQDAERAVAILQEAFANQYRGDSDVRRFVINVHSMKSALAHIGEARLAAVAGTLEEAGRKRDIAAILADTPSFLDALRAAIEKFRPREADEAGETVDEDRAYLREKMLAIQAACAAYDKRAAKEALTALREKTWSRPTGEKLNTLAAYLLHSDFKEAAAVAEETVREP